MLFEYNKSTIKCTFVEQRNKPYFNNQNEIQSFVFLENIACLVTKAMELCICQFSDLNV